MSKLMSLVCLYYSPSYAILIHRNNIVCLAGLQSRQQREDALEAIEYWHSGEGADTRKKNLISMGLIQEPDG